MRRHLPLLLLTGCLTAPPPEADKDTAPPVDTDVAPDTDPPAPDTPADDTDTGTLPLELELVEAADVVEVGQTFRLRVRTSGAPDPSRLTVRLFSDADGALPAPTLDGADFVWNLDGLSLGAHTLKVLADAPDGGRDELTVDMGVCTWPALEDFNAPTLSPDWAVYGDATLDPGGWLEITTNTTNRRGSIYKTAYKINPGDVRIEFDIATGGGIDSGADGYAVNIVDAPDVATLNQYIGAAAAGGCLGYGSAPPCGGYAVNAFHVEFDTWYNAGNPVFDPTPNNHIAIALDGNPSEHVLWQSVFLEDLQWHHVVVQIQGTRILVRLDGAAIIDDVIPNFTFDGGYIGVSGSTGAATNFHRFDNLQIYDRCVVPER
jgi:hypothetical protein